MVAAIAAADGALVGLPSTRRRSASSAGLGICARSATAPGGGSLSGQTVRAGRTLIADDTGADGRVNSRCTRALTWAPRSACRSAAGIRRSACLRSAPGAPTPSARPTSASVGARRIHLDGDRRRHRPDGDHRDACAASRASGRAGRGGERSRFVANVLDPAGSSAWPRASASRKCWGSAATDRVPADLRPGRRRDVRGRGAGAFRGAPCRAPDLWLADAHACGLGVELEAALVRSALDELPQLPAKW